MNYPEALRYLQTLGRELASPSHTRAAKFDLANIRALAAKLGNPQQKFRSVHIAGTNGKGSTAAMMDSILRCAGFRVGLYTSPHLERINERIRIDGAEISDSAFAVTFTEVHAAIEAMLSTGELAAHPTFFECITAMAFLVFAQAEVDYAVLEVGLGGRLDATNIVAPEVSVITQIDFDHENFLGHSIEEIAGEKAGIIEAGVPVVSAAQNPRALEVIHRRAAALGAPLIEVAERYSVDALPETEGTYHASIRDPTSAWRIELQLPLRGRYQLSNAATAVAAARVLNDRGAGISDRAIGEGLESVRWPGRLEKISEHPLVYLDGSHNPAGARELAAFWDEQFRNRRVHLIYGAVRDKAVDEVAGLLFPRAERVTVTSANQPRSISAEALAEMTSHLAPNLTMEQNASEALESAIAAAAPEDVIFVTGSLYLVGELRAYWRNRESAATRHRAG
jgi:dihydrofolate synthase / folylpolyglutamate synthase